MRKCYINAIDKLVSFDENIKSIVIENPYFYRKLVFNLEEELKLSDNNVSLDYKKNILVITNPLDININDSKLVKLLYKKILLDGKENLRTRINDLSNSIKNIIDEISYDLDVLLSVSEEPDISKLFSAFELEFQDPTYESYFEMLIKYIKINNMFSNVKIIVTFGLMNLLTEDEIKSLEEELKLLELNLLNFEIQSKKTKTTFIVDEDWCII